ncbi:hypothetical protein DOE76_13900 [Leifsonia sp. ku-ls]|nr:hypothetical protein DOE76_13900 [Leifsonia sp. ku-ls]
MAEDNETTEVERIGLSMSAEAWTVVVVGLTLLYQKSGDKRVAALLRKISEAIEDDDDRS